MNRFSPYYLKFFRGLKKQNNKEWFDKNRELFDTEVKAPFSALVSEMIDLIREEDREIGITPKDAIFRLNRDTRFSKDKNPYKTYMAANISPDGRRNTELPGFYIQFGADKAMIGGGAYTLEKETLHKVRRAITDHQKEFANLMGEREFKKRYGEIMGEKNKTLPPEFKEAAVKQPFIANKQFYFMAELDPEVILRKDLAAYLMEYYRAGKGVSGFLKRAMK
jgi:uncharacterized protein (TIGR02453 family)